MVPALLQYLGFRLQGYTLKVYTGGTYIVALHLSG